MFIEIKYFPFTRMRNNKYIQDMYKANEEFVIPEEIKKAIKALASK